MHQIVSIAIKVSSKNNRITIVTTLENLDSSEVGLMGTVVHLGKNNELESFDEESIVQNYLVAKSLVVALGGKCSTVEHLKSKREIHFTTEVSKEEIVREVNAKQFHYTGAVQISSKAGLHVE